MNPPEPLKNEPLKNEPLKLINQGTYGCIYYPGIDCQGKKSKKYITKIQEKSEDVGFQNEIEISKRIRTIPNYQHFFAPILETCDIDIAKINTEKCETVGQSIERKNALFVSNKISYLGKTTLYDSFITYLNTRKRKFVTHLFDTFFSILLAIETLGKHNIVHADIKDNNIMIESKNETPIVIDFGQSMYIEPNAKPFDATPIFFSTFAYDKILGHIYYPFDIALLAYLVSKTKENNTAVINDGLAEFKETAHLFYFKSPALSGGRFPEGSEKEQLPSASLKGMRGGVQIVWTTPDAITSFLTKEETTQFQTRIDEYLEKASKQTWESLYLELLSYSHTWDVYSTFCMYLLFYQENMAKLPKTNRDTLEEFIEFSKTQIYCLPKERLSIPEIRKKCDELWKPSTNPESTTL
jgi:serine/threonine protein kinase